jgi:Pectinacetylesterase
MRRVAMALALLGSLLACGAATAAGWVRIAVADGRCARGDPYAFWLRGGSPQKLVLYFQDGGGCWSYETCAPGSGFFQDSLRSPTAPSLPEGGMLDFANPANPFRTFTVAYLPSCTGDVHWGNNVVRYSDGKGGTLTIRHVGFSNAAYALDWVYRRYRAPREVFVTGCSAGSVGSAVFAPYVIRHYPRAVVNQLGDSLAFVFHGPVDIVHDWRADRTVPTWIPQLRALDLTRLTMAQYYSAVAAYYRGHTFAQFDWASDAVQNRYYVAVGGRDGDFPAALAASLAEIHRNAPNFASYVASGSSHCVLPLPAFYTTTVGGVPLSRWTAEVAAGRSVPSVGP